MRQAILVLGAGSWGTALAVMLGRKGLPVYLWGRNQELIDQIAKQRKNPRYLPDVSLPDSVEPVQSLARVKQAEIVIVAVPSSAIRPVLQALPLSCSDPLWVLAAKGLEQATGLRPSQVLQEVMAQPVRFAVLSGPNLALELVRGIPTATVAASSDPAAAAQVQALFLSPTLRVYTNPDVIGVELGGALKNVYAIGGGLSDGLGFGDNTKGALVARGLVEMMRLGVAVGAHAATFTGLTGIGDLFATAASRLSRNYRLGYALAQGKTVEQALQEIGQVVEGYYTAHAAARLAQEQGVEMPILSAIAELLEGRTQPPDALQALMTRPPKEELEFQFWMKNT